MLRGRRAIGARRGVEGGWGPLSEGVGAAAAAVAAATEAGKRREGCGGAAVAAPLRRQSPGSRLEPASRPELQPGKLCRRPGLGLARVRARGSPPPPQFPLPPPPPPFVIFPIRSPHCGHCLACGWGLGVGPAPEEGWGARAPGGSGRWGVGGG